MAVPKKKRSYTKRGMRRSHHALKEVNLKVCPVCDKAVLSHRVCEEKAFDCGMYKNK